MDTQTAERDTEPVDRSRSSSPATVTPHLALLHGSMLLSGFGMVFLGPVLPALAASAGASDSGSGLFFAAQFAGSFLGGVTTSKRLWFSLIRGSAAAALGFAALAFCVHQHASQLADAAALFPLGFGVGQMLTSVNLLASQSLTKERGAALARVNFSLSLGAVIAPFALGSLLAAVPLHLLLVCASLVFVLICIAAFANGRKALTEAAQNAAAQSRTSLPTMAFVYFAALLFLYGGVETSLSGWVTTFGTRYGAGTVGTSALGATALWCGITAGRALTPLILRRTREHILLRISLLAAALLVAALSRADGATSIVAISALLGLSLAPWFPLVLSSMLGEGAAPAQVGSIIAVSGLGAAALPFLVGLMSHATGSLRLALMLPLAGVVLLLGLSFRRSVTTN